jgi:hypothetical protein
MGKNTKIHNKFSFKFSVIIAVMTQLVFKKNAQLGFNKSSSLLVHDKKWRHQHAKTKKIYMEMMHNFEIHFCI